MVFQSRRAGPPTGGGGVVAAPEEDPLSRRFPLVFQFLTRTSYDDGQSRETGSITLFFDAGVVKACLNDKDASLAAFVSGEGLEGLLVSMEEGLAGDRLDWRPARKKGGRRG